MKKEIGLNDFDIIEFSINDFLELYHKLLSAMFLPTVVEEYDSEYFFDNLLEDFIDKFWEEFIEWFKGLLQEEDFLYFFEKINQLEEDIDNIDEKISDIKQYFSNKQKLSNNFVRAYLARKLTPLIDYKANLIYQYLIVVAEFLEFIDKKESKKISWKK